MAGNSNLHDSAKNKQDEFYTRLQLIEDELKHYRDHFKGKRVLSRLDGDFRSPECVALLKDADIVVTNPPFSLFREYMALLMEHGKQFLIIGNMNAAICAEIFPLFRDNRVWLGYNSGHYWFKVPDSYEAKSTDFKIDENGQKWRRMGNICWFANLDIEKRHEQMLLWKNYSPDQYSRYDDYDAIEIGKTADIPCDYDGKMGVPVTFMAKHNPDQFEIVGLDRYVEDNPHYGHRFKIAGKETCARIIIRRRRKGKGEAK